MSLSRQVRRQLDSAGLKTTKIFASGDLDEFVMADLLARGAQIDAFGVGTALTTSEDAPAVGGVYKLVDLESEGEISYRAKFSLDKTTYPGRKQLFRFCNADGTFREDIIACGNEQFQGGEPLLQCVMRNGSRISSFRDISSIQRHAIDQVQRIPAACTRLQNPEHYTVKFSQRLESLLRLVRRQVTRESNNGGTLSA